MALTVRSQRRRRGASGGSQIVSDCFADLEKCMGLIEEERVKEIGRCLGKDSFWVEAVDIAAGCS